MDKIDDHQEAVKTIKNLRQQADQPSNPPNLPSYQTRQRPFEELYEAEWQPWNWQPWSNSPSSSSSATWWQRWFIFCKEFAYKRWRFPLQATGGVISALTSHAFTRTIFLERVAQGVASFSQCTLQCLFVRIFSKIFITLLARHVSHADWTFHRYHLHRALRTHLHYCSLHTGLPLPLRKLGCCLVDRFAEQAPLT